MLPLKTFNEEVNIAVPYLRANLKRLGYSEELTKGLEDYLDQWNEIFPKAEDKASRTSVLVAQRNTLREAFEKAYTKMQQTLKNNATITLTEEDYKKLYIHIDKKQSPNKPPEEIPSLDVIELRQSTIVIQVSIKNPKAAINYTHTPKGWEINVFVAIVSTESPMPKDDDYNLFVTTGKSNITLNFDTKYEKMEAYIRAEFVNKNGKSRMSDPISAVIPK